MLTGRVTKDLEARMLVVFMGADGQISVEVVIDTGFNGYITLPPELIERLTLPQDGTVETELGDGSIVAMRKFFGFVEWHGGRREVTVLEGGGQPLAGMALLAESSLAVEVKAGGAVRIAPLNAG